MMEFFLLFRTNQYLMVALPSPVDPLNGCPSLLKSLPRDPVLDPDQ